MAITLSELTYQGPGLWLVSWTSDLSTPTFRIYQDGVLVSRQTDTEYLVRADGSVFPVLELLDDADEIPNEAHPGEFYLGWENESDAARYKIEEYSGGEWTQRALILNSDERPWITYATGPLADETSHQWRITPVDSAGNEGTLISFTKLMVRYPDPPQVTMTYDSGTAKVTIT